MQQTVGADTSDSSSRRALSGGSRAYVCLSCVALLVLLTRISADWMLEVHGSGVSMADAPQYANAGAMSGIGCSRRTTPSYNFAARNYARYPAFHMPYHPPRTRSPRLFFSITGVSYDLPVCSWRCVCSSGVFFLAFLRRTGCNRAGALAGALLLITMPQVAYGAATRCPTSRAWR
jgi:hypothetical protein